MREVLNTLMRREVALVPPEMVPHFQDLYDHVLRVTESTESLRDLVATVVETNLARQGNRLNITTRKLTSWAAIIAVPTAPTGYYSQNLPSPGFAQDSGAIASSAIIVALSGGLFVTFRRKRWL